MALYFFQTLKEREANMSKASKIAEMGILNILNQMKNPLTNIRLSLDMMENDSDVDRGKCREIIKNSAISLEDSIRDLCQSFGDLGVTIHLETDRTPLESFHLK